MYGKYTEWLFLHDANKYVKSGECGGDVNHKINSAESLLSILRLWNCRFGMTGSFLLIFPLSGGNVRVKG
jgi:hypothetical protein